MLWILEGHRDADIKESLAEAYPKEDAGKLIADTLKYLAIVSRSDTTVLRGWCLEAYRELYRKMVDVGDYAGAIRAVKELHKIAQAANYDED